MVVITGAMKEIRTIHRDRAFLSKNFWYDEAVSSGVPDEINGSASPDSKLTPLSISTQHSEDLLTFRRRPVNVFSNVDNIVRKSR